MADLIITNRQPRHAIADEIRPLAGEFVTTNARPPSEGVFLLPVCVDERAMTRLLSAAWLGAELVYREQSTSVVAPLLQAIELWRDDCDEQGGV